LALKTTPVHQLHNKYGGKMVDFGGWELPIEFKTGIIAEHHQVREKAGLFDVSHMGEIEVKGKQAEKLFEMTNKNDT